MLGSLAMNSMCTSGCGMRAVLVGAGAYDAGLVIRSTMRGKLLLLSAGIRIASNDCIKSIAAPEHPKGPRIVSQRRRSSLEPHDDSHRTRSEQGQSSLFDFFFLSLLLRTKET